MAEKKIRKRRIVSFDLSTHKATLSCGAVLTASEVAMFDASVKVGDVVDCRECPKTNWCMVKDV